MKYLSDYLRDEQTRIFNENGAFFAFGNAQFEERRKEGVTYTQLGSGLIVPVENAEKVSDALEVCLKNGIESDIAENGIDGVIRRELNNHECFYDGDLSRCVEALEGYNISLEQIVSVYNDTRHSDYDY